MQIEHEYSAMETTDKKPFYRIKNIHIWLRRSSIFISGVWLLESFETIFYWNAMLIGVSVVNDAIHFKCQRNRFNTLHTMNFKSKYLFGNNRTTQLRMVFSAFSIWKKWKKKMRVDFTLSSEKDLIILKYIFRDAWHFIYVFAFCWAPSERLTMCTKYLSLKFQKTLEIPCLTEIIFEYSASDVASLLRMRST